MDALYRAIVGTVEPLRRDHEVPEQYRRTLPAPPAPTVSEAEVPPITAVPNDPSIS